MDRRSEAIPQMGVLQRLPRNQVVWGKAPGSNSLWARGTFPTTGRGNVAVQLPEIIDEFGRGVLLEIGNVGPWPNTRSESRVR